jgi:hypothetical protein
METLAFCESTDGWSVLGGQVEPSGVGLLTLMLIIQPSLLTVERPACGWGGEAVAVCWAWRASNSEGGRSPR